MSSDWIPGFAAAAATIASVAGLWFAARRDARAARAEFQTSVELLVTSKLDPMDNDLKRIDTDIQRIDTRIIKVEDGFSELRADVAKIRGWIGAKRENQTG